MKVILCLFLLNLTLSIAFLQEQNSFFKDDVDNDMFKTMDQIAAENGWATESYNITTSDGYILELWRIPGKLGESNTQPKPPVLMMHGLEVDMMCWVMNEPSKAPAFMIAGAGYDVWLGNNRGCKYGLHHESMNTSQKDFWRFDQEQMGIYDVPAFVEFIQEKTGVQKISYLGHSQGTTQYFCGNSLIPEWYENNINIAIMLAPVAKIYHTTNKKIIDLDSPVLIDLIEAYVENKDMYYVLGPNREAQERKIKICDLIGDKECAQLISVDIRGMNASIANLKRVKTYMSLQPSGAGYQTLIRYAQSTEVDKFQRYDFGKIENLVVYGQASAPEYDIANINTPLALFSGSLDSLADPVDVQWIKDQIGDQIVFDKEYELDHDGFILAQDMSWLADDVISVMDKYNKN